MNFNIANAANLLKKVQDEVQRMQEELSKTEITGSDPSKKVVVTVNGQQEIIGLSISKDVVDPNDVEMLSDLVMFAVRDAMNKSKEYAEEKLGSVYQGLPIPNVPGFRPKF